MLFALECHDNSWHSNCHCTYACQSNIPPRKWLQFQNVNILILETFKFCNSIKLLPRCNTNVIYHEARLGLFLRKKIGYI